MQLIHPAPIEIVVTGRSVDAKAPGVARGTRVIDRRAIEATASDRFENVIANVAGVASFRRSDSSSAHPTSGSIGMRGLGGSASSRALLVIDGVPAADPFGGWISFPALDLQRIGEIRVTRGGGSALWGPGALAGTIEVDSATPDQLPDASATLLGGSRASLDGHAQVMAAGRSGFVTLAAHAARGDGFVPIISSQRGPADRAAPYRQWSLGGRAVRALAPATELQLNFSTFSDRRDRGVDFTANRTRGVDGSVRLVGNGTLPFALLAYGQRRRFASQFASVDDARTSASEVLDQHVRASGWGGRAEILPSIGSLKMHVGGDVRAVRGTTDELFAFAAGTPTKHREAGGNAVTAGVFADVADDRGRWRWELAGRLDHWRIGQGRLIEQTLAGAPLTDARFAPRHGWVPTMRAAAEMRPGRAVSLQASVYRGWRLPTLNELYRPFRAGADATAANAELKPETSWGGDTGVTWGSAARQLALVAFAQRVDNPVVNVTLGHGPGMFPGVGFVSAAGDYRQRRNLHALDSHGIEVDARITLRTVEFMLSYALTDARIDDPANPALDGKRPAQTALHSATASARWSPRAGYQASLTLHYAGSRFEDDLNSEKLRPAFTADVAGRYRLGSRAAIIVRAENLFDARIEAGRNDGLVERGAPRTLWLGLELSAPR